MPRKLIVAALAAAIVISGVWCRIYGAYLDVHESAAALAAVRDWQGAADLQGKYRSSLISLPVYRIDFFRRYRAKLLYSEGVVKAAIGDAEGAKTVFREAIQSFPTGRVAAEAHYNLSLLDIGRDDLDLAAVNLRRALTLSPEDRDIKINLELVLRELSIRKDESAPEKRGLPRRPADRKRPGEQWRFEPPDRDGLSGPDAGRRYL